MKKNLPVIVIACVLILGVCVLLYPLVSAILTKQTQYAAIESYQRTVENLSDKEIAELKTETQKYNESLYGAVLSDPFSDGEKVDTNYVRLLNVDDAMGYLQIPKINVSLPIYHGSTPEVLEKGVGHLENTSLPIGGKNTHAVLSGHRGLPSSTLFTDLDQLGSGDLFYIHILGETLTYQIDQIKVVEPDDTSDLRIVTEKDYVTLVTCTPYGVNTQRLLVRGERLETTAAEKPVQAAIQLTNEAAVLPAAFPILAAVPIVLFVTWKRRKAGK